MTLLEMFAALPEEIEGEITTADQKYVIESIEEDRKENGCRNKLYYKYLIIDAFRIHRERQEHKKKSMLPFITHEHLWEEWEGGQSTGSIIDGTERPHELGSQLDQIKNK